ncbi:centrosome-associated zinc finger protein CP190 [Culex pipiens pallens]|uniref:centrosome-associated zinc finger protein CP190 n=1 Tax=Culex pipiens pallens TaxID=42434 RepID=UPI0019536FB6|nr:centrosome-associated zinc finger protein CP190 [Culex pipiens pallens]XP_039442938.1 centrosome-associated zinc finger protein CP190 [Culex pipiens pallens]
MTRLTETKSVKVDNWGVFFLQKLQNFFNKTDHCDLTLQFNDNSQLKVHRLVLSACTDYFNMLESTCEMYDDVLIMPLDLQADVIVPIVNFMYTGTLEFQYGIYEKLLKTAKDMNMTVLLKLLEAHKQTTRINQNVGRQPVLLNKQAPSARGRNPQSSFHSAPSRSYGAIRQPAPVRTGLPQRPAVTMVKHQTTIAALTPSHKGQAPDPHALVSKYGAAKGKQGAGPTRFDESGVPETLEGNFDDISYESTPLVTADQIKKEEETSPFEKLRKGYTNVAKRPAPVSFSTPAAKKPNLQEVKEFTEAARLRSQLAADDDDSPGIADDTQFDDDEEEEGQQTKQLPTKPSPNLKQIVIKQEPKTSPGGGGVKQITVKDESGSVDHAKIISEVLKKYPHLVKKNKNIKLKIMQKTSPQAQSASASATPSAPVKMEVRTATPLKADISMVRRATEAIRQPAAPASTPTPSTPSSGPKKIDSKTMHALIAKGAENMTGPWLCLRCGIDGRPISIPSYKAFRNHLIVKHKEKIDARICEHCGWRAEQRNPNLFYHWLTEHNIKSTIKFPTCAECGHVAMNATLLAKHEEENHQRGDLQQCIYCNKVFAKEMDLYDHMKALHKEKAREDGVIDFSDDEYQMEEEGLEDPTPSPNKIKILSNISITNNAGLPFVIDTTGAQTVSQIGGKSQLQIQQITLEPSSEAEALSNVASGIATSLGLVDASGVVIEDGTFHHQNHQQQQQQYIEHQMATVHGETGTTTTISAAGGPDQLTKLITEDGTELQLTQSQKEEIFSQLQNSGNGGNVVMVLNDDQFITGAGLQLEDGTELINAGGSTADGGQNSNIMVMYSQAGDELATQSTVTTTTVAASSGKVKEVQKVASVVEEEETSQASTQPSEKEVEAASEKGEDSQMSVDPESSQDKGADDTRDSEVDEEEEAARLAKEEEEKAAKEKEKLKLISELEGDWSEDTEEQPAAAEPEPEPVQEEEAKKVEVPTEKEKPAPSKSKEDPKKQEAVATATEEAANEKEIDRLLDEWHSEVKADEAEEAETADADLEKKLEKVVGEEKTEEEPPAKAEEEEEPATAPAEEAEPATTADQTPDVSVDEASMNDSETTQVVIVAAESETDTSMREDETSQQEEVPAAEEATSVDEKKQVEEEEAAAKEDEPEAKDNGEAAKEEEDGDDEAKEPEEDKTKSKEVVNSLLGDWDEDDDL